MPEAALEARWRALAEKAIGAPLETMARGIAPPIQPIYDRRTTDCARPWRLEQAWSVAQRIDHPDAEQANRLALLDLEGGADALTLVMAGGPYSRGFGLATDAATLDLALDAIELDLITLRLDAGADTLATTESLAALVERRRLTSAGLVFDLGFDPTGLFARTGRDSPVDALPRLLDLHAKAGLDGRPLLADARPFHEAGADPAQELAAVLATAVAYLRRLEALGLGLDAASRMVAILLVVDADAFVSLAKMRAVRRLWARVAAASGLAAEPLRLHAETAWRMMSRTDPWVNVMRATAGVFAAGLGGADVVTALPFTLALGLPEAGARRLARNTQRVLIDEAHLDAVDDPAAGSGGFEALTDDFCVQAWLLFQEIEREGGIDASLTAGTLQARIAVAAGARAAAVATRRQGLVGTSLYPHLGSPRQAVLDVAPHAAAGDGPGALPSLRDAAPYEALRDQADALGRPKAFIAALGEPAAFGPRADDATNVLAAAGIEATTAARALDAAEMAALFDASGAPVACLCGSHEAYLAAAAATAQALRRAGVRRLLMAGAPGDEEARWRAAGIDAFLHDGCDAPRVLAETLKSIADAGDR